MNTQQNEFESLQQPKKSQNKLLAPVSYFSLFKFATKADYCLITLSAFCAIGDGLSMPVYAVIFGMLTDSFAENDNETKMREAEMNALYLVILAISTFFVTLTMYATFSISTENQITKLKKKYLSSLLKKNVSWYDSINTNTLNTKVNSEVLAINEAIGEKAVIFAFSVATVASGFLIGFIKGWKLALVILSAFPILALTIALIGFTASWREQFTIKSDLESSAQVEEVLSSIKTVKMLGGEEFEVQRFQLTIQHSSKSIIKYGLYYGLAFGAMCAIKQWTYALGAYYSGQIVQNQINPSSDDQIYTSGSMSTIFIAILLGCVSLGKIGPCLSSFAKGKLAAAEVFEVIEEESENERQEANYLTLDNFQGDIKIKSLSFSYPTKPDVEILKNVSFVMPAGKKIALVGESGSGKSTIAQLLLQFYDAKEGSIVVGDNDIPINQFEKHEFRSLTAIVSQEPVLFATTIKENIKLGNQKATDEEIIQLLEFMNASKLIEHLDTNVGTNGNQFSGGQKQRIALARALISKPQLLILDEATSALDRTNEQQITQIIDDKFKSITRLVIAHRLSTIQDSDQIIVFHQGEIVGQGTHDELLKKNQHYQYLIKKQQTQEDQAQIKTQSTIEGNTYKNSISQNSPIKQEIQKTNIKSFAELLSRQRNKQQSGTMSDNNLSFSKCLIKIIVVNYREIAYLIIGCLSALLNGSIYPLFSQILSEVIEALLVHNPLRAIKEGHMENIQYEIDTLNSAIIQSTQTLFVLGFIYFVSTTIECFCFSVYSERLTIQMKTSLFQKFLRLPISFYDNPQNNAGSLTPKISQDARQIQQFFQNIVGFNCQYYSAMIVGFSLALAASWKLTLLAIGLLPFLYIGSRISQKYVVGSLSSFNSKVYMESNKILMEALTNIRTVYALRAEELIFNQYNQLLIEQEKQSKKFGFLIGISAGYAQTKPFFVNAFLFFMGTLLLVYDDLTVLGIYQTILAIIFAVNGGAKVTFFQSDNEKAKNAINYYFNLLEVKDEFQLEDQSNSARLKQKINGNIEFKNVSFSYPQRPSIQVLKNLNLRIEACKHIGLVGISGCGKSTIFQLLLRFYTIDEGEILIDGKSIQDYDLRYLREQISIVSQEPQLFSETIKYNIQYNLKNVTDENIKQVSILSHAYDFIMQDSEQKQAINNKGFDKRVGTKGSLISGGQKQRIAIARALLRNSSVYLFDEATSALDSNVESIVQNQLEEYLISKTSLVIAHRISTIKNSSVIYVFDEGQIIEQGNYDYLVKQKGYFYRLEQGLQKESQQQMEIQGSIIQEGSIA